MRYTGRLTLTSTTAIFCLLYFFVTLQTLGMYTYLLDFFYLLLSWFLGRQYDITKYYSEKDVLTGVLNKRYLNVLSKKLLKKISKQKGTASIIVVDVNDFKIINDGFGHVFGDFVLKQVAAILKNSCRKDSLVARWGGDEFLLIIPNLNYQEATSYVLVIQSELRSLSESFRAEITASIGIAVYPDDAKTLEDLIYMADLNMYHDKREFKTM